MATREQVYSALFALGQGITWGSPPVTWEFTMRRVKTPDQVTGMMPALCQGEFLEESQQTTRMPQLRTFQAAWFIYHYDGNPDAIMATTTNQILDAIDALFPADGERPGARRQTLGGLVHKCWISGRIEKFGGNIDEQVLIVVPISMMVPLSPYVPPTPPPSNWILAGGIWSDSGVWIDTSVWQD